MRTISALSDAAAAAARRRRVTAAALWAVAVTTLAAPSAAGVRAKFVNDKGEAVHEAVIALTPASGAPAPKASTAVIDQIDKEYVPRITPIVVGTSVQFPNQDDIRHHVYSMSKPKKFELPLYEGTPAEPVVFDRPGMVVLGCNIHDWMRAYVYVFETPYFAVSDEDGQALLQDIPPGEYDAEVWHPQQKGDDPLTRRVTVTAGGEASLDFELELKRKFGVRRAPRAGGRKYR